MFIYQKIRPHSPGNESKPPRQLRMFIGHNGDVDVRIDFADFAAEKKYRIVSQLFS